MCHTKANISERQVLLQWNCVVYVGYNGWNTKERFKYIKFNVFLIWFGPWKYTVIWRNTN